MEFIRETNWKNHRKQDINIIKSNMKEEWVDIFKYWLSIGVLWGFKPENFIDEYYRKSEVVRQRYKQEKMLNFNGNKIAGIDIDGVLADYPERFISYVNEKIGTSFKVEDLKEYNLYEAITDVPTDVMLDLKDEFRKSGELKNMKVMDGAKNFLYKLKDNNYHIVLLSARPYKEYKRIFADTQEWLDKNNLLYDAILWDEDKCNRLIREFGNEKIEFFVEDHIENANDVAKTAKCYLVNRPYNRGSVKRNVKRVCKLSEILQMEGVK